MYSGHRQGTELAVNLSTTCHLEERKKMKVHLNNCEQGSDFEELPDTFARYYVTCYPYSSFDVVQ